MLLGASVLGVQRFNVVARADLPKSGAYLHEKARETLDALGYRDPPRDRIWNFSTNDEYLEHLRQRDPSADVWAPVERPQPAAIAFDYWESPGWLDFDNSGGVNDWVAEAKPTRPGDLRVRLDPLGRLLRLDAVPPELADSTASTGTTTSSSETPAEPDWTALLAAAGLDPAALTDAEPEWLPRRGFDRRRAWTGVYPDAPDVPIRVEAAAFLGRPVEFRIVEPWSVPAETARSASTGPGSGGAIVSFVGTLIYILLHVTAAVFAWRNVRLGRGDRRTALRFALALAALRFAWYVLTHHIGSPDEIFYFEAHLAWSLYRFGLAYVLYLAIEPYARKLWPRMLTSWVRLFAGRFRDPLVGRDVLVGLALAAGLTALGGLLAAIAEWLRLPPVPAGGDEWTLTSLRGLSGALMAWTGIVTTDVLSTFRLVILIFGLRLICRRDWITLIPMILIAFVIMAGVGLSALTVTGAVIFVAALWFALFRVGLLALIVFGATAALIANTPLTFDLTAWWATPTWWTLATLLFVALWSFRMSLAGQPVFRDRVLGEG